MSGQALPQAELERLVAWTDDMIEQGLIVTRDWLNLWTDGLNYIFNNQLHGKVRRKGWERIQANYVWPAMIQEISLAAQRKPDILALPWEESDKKGAAFWQSVLRYQFEKELRVPWLALSARLDAKIYGYYVAKVYWEDQAEWDQKAEKWVGKVRAVLLPPAWFGADPECESIDGARYTFSRRRASVEEAKNRWPKFAKEIEEAAASEEDIYKTLSIPSLGMEAKAEQATDASDDETSLEGRLVRLLSKARGYRRDNSRSQGSNVPKAQYVTITEIYFRDLTTEGSTTDERIPVEDLPEGAFTLDGTIHRVADTDVFKGKQTGDPIMLSDWPTRKVAAQPRPVFPFGRCIVRAGKTILNPKREDQVYQYHRWPFVVGVNTVLPHVWQGMNGVEMARGLQDWINVSLSHLCNYIKFFGDPVTVIEEGALSGDTENKNVAQKLKAVAGAIWKVAKGGLNKIRREAPAPFNAGVVQIYELMAREIQDQTGVHEVARGKQAATGQTATEISLLASNTQTRTALQCMLEDDWIVRVMELVAEIDQDKLEAGQMVRIAGERNAPAVAQVEQGFCDTRFDLSLKVGTTLPFDRERIKQDHERLFTMFGPAVAPEVLDAFNVDNADEVLGRYSVWQEMLQFQAQQAAMAKGGEQAPPPGAAQQ